jgi:hypothetical protein
MRRVRLVRLFPVTVDDGIDVHVNASSTIADCFEIWFSFLPLPKIQLHRCTKMRKGAGPSKLKSICRVMYGVSYVPYFLPFSNFVLFFHFPISYDF